MLGASLVFLTLTGGLVMLAVAIPLTGLALAAHRERQARELLRLRPPPAVSRIGRVACLVAIPVLLGLAAMQPALRSTKSAHVRTDAEAFFVVDISRSMLASRGPGAPTRFARAKDAALTLRDSIPEVPSGIATLTDRVLPNLFPNPDRNVFGQTLQQAVSIAAPPPQSSNVLATSLGALGSLGSQNFFGRSATRRVAVVLTDGESAAFDASAVAHDLATGPGVRLVVVRLWNQNESVYDSGGSAEQAYKLHPESAEAVSSLVSAAGGRSFGDGSLGSATRAIQAAVGSGPTRVEGQTLHTRTLAPFIALLALLPLLLVIPRVGRGLGSAARVFTAGGLQKARARKRHPSDYSPRSTGVPATGRQRS